MSRARIALLACLIGENGEMAVEIALRLGVFPEIHTMPKDPYPAFDSFASAPAAALRAQGAFALADQKCRQCALH